jgi:putative tryptophan/tyrosine transport system substrate-binding protein
LTQGGHSTSSSGKAEEIRWLVLSLGGRDEATRFLLAAATLVTGMPHAMAQQSPTKKRVAVMVLPVRNDAIAKAFDEELKRGGYVEGENLIIERHESRAATYLDVTREVVESHPDVIVCSTVTVAARFKELTSTIPVVAFTGDPVGLGLVASLAHPGGNITGVSVDAGIEIWGKRLELLAEAVPKLVNVLFVSTQGGWNAAGGRTVREAAQKLGIALVSAIVNSPYDEAEYRRTCSSIQKDQLDGIAFSDEGPHYRNRFLLVQLIQQLRIPAIYTYRDQVEYSYDIPSAVRAQARQVVEILRGANPGDIPYFQLDRFELVINLKTAKELGLEMPAGLVAGAAAVIE